MRRHRLKTDAPRALAGFSVARGDYLSVHWNDSPFGSGVRSSVVAHVGRKWITLLDPTILRFHKVTPRDLLRGRARRVDLPAGDAARMIADRAALYRRLGCYYPKVKVRNVLKRLAA